jgi:glycosyltransferase involved in cell wall biosynthesis
MLTLFVRVLFALRARQPGAVVGLQPLSNLFAGIAGRLAGVRNRVATLHNPADRFNRALMTADRAIAALGFYRHIVACSRSVADSFARFGPRYLRHVSIVPNGHPAPRLIARAEARSRLGLPADGVVLGQIGRLSAQKNQAFSVELLRDLPGDTLLVVGIGPDEKALKAQVEAAGLGKRVRLIPAIEHSRMGEFYSAVDLVLFPSRFEGLSLAGIEAIHAGVPLLCSDIASFREMFASSSFLTSTLLLPLADKAAWRARIAALTHDDMLRGRVRAELERLAPAYAFERMAADYLRILA